MRGKAPPPIWVDTHLMTNRLAALENDRKDGGDHSPKRPRSRISVSTSSSRSSSVEAKKSDNEDSKGESKEEQKEEPKEKGTMTTKINRVPWMEFKRKFDVKKDITQLYAIDVLAGKPVIPYEVWRNRFLRENPVGLNDQRRFKLFRIFGGMKQAAEESEETNINIQNEPSAAAKQSQMSKDKDKDFYAQMPDRLRINGGPLAHLLEKSLDVELNASSSPAVLLRPFKLLVHHNNTIRDLYSQLTEKFEKKPSTTQEQDEGKKEEQSGDGKDPSGAEAAGKSQSTTNEESLLDTYGTEQAYKELGTLIKFMDEDLKTVKQFEDGSITKVYFSDLWHVFRPGDEVIASSKPLNAYRVYHTAGGRPYLSPPKDSEEESGSDFARRYRIPEQSSDFSINAYQMDFDGIKLGPVRHSFSIQKYDGLRDITSLPVYPLRFAKDRESVRKTLQSNGHTFNDLARGGYVQYRGMNLHEAEDIESQVIVDFNAALWDSQDKISSWDFKIEFGIRPPAGANKAEVTMVSAGGCTKANCCENDFIFNDLSIDDRRMEDFITEKPLLTTDIRYLNDDVKQIPEEDFILFPHRLFAFVLKDRKWGKPANSIDHTSSLLLTDFLLAVIDVNNVKKVPETQQEGWKSLVLPRGHKEMVYSLVQAHFRNRGRVGVEDESQADLVRGKGKNFRLFYLWVSGRILH